MFIGRKNELKKLEKLYLSEQFECIVMYGRRRVGKTTLINEFCKNKPTIYFTGIEASSKINLENLSDSIFRYAMPQTDAYPIFENYQRALDYIHDLAREKQLVVVFDEYPYLASSERSISSILQLYIDTKFKDSKGFLILCGSSMSFMEKQVLGYQSPLYGRRTAQMKVTAFDYKDTSLFYPHYSSEDQALLYGITGGVPSYIEKFNPKDSIEQNIIEKVLNDSSYLFEEPGNLLKQELREPQWYNSIITAIARGASRLNDVALSVGIASSLCSVYLQTLQSLGIVKKETPFGEGSTRKTIYRIEDNLFLFWYRYIAKHVSSVTQGNGEYLFETHIKPYLNDYMGIVFEKMCMEFLQRENHLHYLPFFFPSIGRWWGTDPKRRIQVEIDIVAASQIEKKILVGECKYRSERTGLEVYNNLMNNSKVLSKNYAETYYSLFSKSGFSVGLKEQVKENPNVLLFTLSDLYNFPQLKGAE